MVDSKIALIIAVIVIVVIAALIYFYEVGKSGSGILTIGGTSAICTPMTGLTCMNASINSNGSINFEFGQNTGGPMFNLAFACTTQETSSGGPDTTINPFIHLGNSTLSSGGSELIRGLPCYDPSGNKTSLTYAYLWISYSGSVKGVSNTVKIGTVRSG